MNTKQRILWIKTKNFFAHEMMGAFIVIVLLFLLIKTVEG